MNIDGSGLVVMLAKCRAFRWVDTGKSLTFTTVVVWPVAPAKHTSCIATRGSFITSQSGLEAPALPSFSQRTGLPAVSSKYTLYENLVWLGRSNVTIPWAAAILSPHFI